MQQGIEFTHKTVQCSLLGVSVVPAAVVGTRGLAWPGRLSLTMSETTQLENLNGTAYLGQPLCHSPSPRPLLAGKAGLVLAGRERENE